MRKQSWIEENGTDKGSGSFVRHAKVFGIKTMATIMTASMVLTGVPVQAIADGVQTDDTFVESNVESSQNDDTTTTDTSSGQTLDQGTAESSSAAQDNAVDTGQNQGSQAASQDKATTADVALELNNASITYLGQVIAQPAQKVTAPADADFKFSAAADNGFKLNKVKLTVDGAEQELKADTNGEYTIAAADVAKSPKVTLETEQEQQAEATEDATPIEQSVTDGSAVVVQDASDVKTVEVGESITLTAKNKTKSWSGWSFSNQGLVTDVKSDSGSNKVTFTGSVVGSTTVAYTYQDANWQNQTETFNVEIVDRADSKECGIAGPSKVITDEDIELIENKDADYWEWHLVGDGAYDTAHIVSANGNKLKLKGWYQFADASKTIKVQCIYKVPGTNTKYTDEYEITVKKRTWKITDWTYVEGTHFCIPTIVDSVTGETVPEWEGGYRKEYFINGESVGNAPWTGAFKNDNNSYEVKIYPFGHGENDTTNSKYCGEATVVDPVPNKDKTPIDSDSPSDVDFDGQEHKWVPTVTDKKTGEILGDTEYEVKYKRGDEVTDDFTTPGTITVEIKGKHHHTGEIEKSYTISEKKIELSVSGPDTVEQFDTIQLTPSLSPTQKGGTYSWTSNNENILTVDKNGKVAGVSEGKATVTVTWTSDDGKTVLTADHDVTVTHTTNGTTDFTFYYLNDPSGNLDSINTGNWQKLGTGRVNLSGYDNSNFPKDNGKTKKYDAKARVTKWPDGSTSATLDVKRGGTDWNLIVKMYQSEIKKQLPNVDVKDSDIESIELVPYKLTRNDDGYHVDCQVVVKCKGLYTVKYWVDDPTASGEGYQQVAVTTTAREGDTTNISDFNQNYPESKTVGGVEYTFSGWFLDEGLTKSASLPYVVRNSNLNFYAKYVAGRMVKYDLQGGSWKNGAGTTYKVNAGKTHTVLAEPTREGYEFAGWTISGLDGKTSVGSGDTFTMPDNNVTITAQWTKKTATVTVDYLWGDKDSHELIESNELTGDYHFEDVVDVTKDFDGYTVKSGQSAKRVLDAGENVINVYYYKNVTLTAESGTKTYTGEKWTVEGYASSDEDAKFDDVTAKGSGIDAGEYEVAFNKDYTGTVSKDAKYIVSGTTPGKLTIVPIAKELVISITGHSGGEKYNGKEQTVKGYDVSGLPKGASVNDVLYDGTAEAKGTDADTYYMNLDAKKFSLKESVAKNYSKVTFEVAEDGRLTIARRKITLWSEDGHKNYDGAALQRRADINVDGTKTVWDNKTGTESKKTFDGDGFVKGEGVEGKTKTTWFNQNGDGDEANIMPGVYENRFSVTFKGGTNPDNYDITYDYGKLYVNKRVDKERYTVTINAVSKTDAVYTGGVHSTSGVYASADKSNGSASGMTFTNKQGVVFTITGFEAGANGTNAGTYESKVVESDARVVDQNGNDVTDQFILKKNDGKLVINKAEATITSRSGTQKYNGKAFTLHEFDCTGFVGTDTPQFNDVEWTGSQTDVGKSDNMFKYEPKGRIEQNYKVTCKFGKLNVTDNDDEVVVNILMNSDSVPYDGQPHSVNGYTVTSITGEAGYTADDIKFNGGELSGTDAGTYENKGTDTNGNSLFQNKNSRYTKVKFVVTDGKLTIIKRKVTLASSSDEKVYDGTALTKNEVKVTYGSFVEGEGFTAQATGSQLDAGTSDNVFTYTLNDGTKAENYEIVTKSGALKVTPVTDQVVVTVKGKTETTKYDGTEHKLSGYTVESISNPLYTKKDFEYTGNESVKGTDVPATSSAYTKKIAGTSFKNLNTKNFTNVTFKSDGPITLAITPRNITLKAADGHKVYDGNALTNDKVTVSGEGFANGEGATYTVNGSQTDAGTTKNVVAGWQFDSNTKARNYNVATEEGTLEVTPVTDQITVTINGAQVSHEYDGGDHTASGYTVSINNKLYKESDFSFDGTASVTAKNVSESKGMGLKKEDFTNTSANFSNVEFVVNDGSVTIMPRAATVKSADLSKEYDGDALVNGDTSLETTGFIDGEGVVGKNFTGSQTVVGSTANAYEYDAAEGTDLGNYSVDKQTGTLTVTNRAAKYEVTVKAKSAKATYDGEKHVAKGVETYEFTKNGKKYTVSGLTTEDPEQVNAGTYTNNIMGTPVVKDAKGNDVTDQFKVNTENGSLVIAKRKVTIKSKDAEKTYDGKPLTKHDVKVEEGEFAENEGLVYAFSGTQTEAGSSSNSFTYTAKKGTNLDNYEIKKSEGTLKVNPVTDAVTVTITGSHKTVMYNGSDQKIDGYGVEIKGSKLYATNDFSFIGTAEVTGKDAATDAYPMGLTKENFKNVSKNFTNVTFVVVDGWLKIDPINITLTARGATKPYDGTPLTNNTVDITSGAFIDGEGVTCTTTGSQIEPGDSDNTFDYVFNKGTEAGNYDITKASEKLIVTKSGKEVVVTIKPNGGTYTYNGTERAASGYTVTGISNELYSENDFTFNGNAEVKATDAGTYNMDIKPSDFTNHSNRFNKVTFVIEENPLVINRKDVQVTTPNASKVYDGTALTAEGKIEGLVKGETVDFKTTGSQTEQGSSSNTYQLNWDGTAKKSNYNVLEPSIGTLTVTKQSINPENTNSYKGITVGNLKDVKYNGKDQKQEPVVKNGSAGLVKGRDYELSYSRDTVNAGEVTVTVKGIGNYTGEVTRTYNITPRHVKLSSNTHSKTYDGTALTDATVVETGEDSFVTGEVSNIRATGSITIPGTVDNSITFDKGEKFKESNYVIEYQTGKLTVDHKDVASRDMTVGKPNDTIYNGHEQKFEPVVKDGEKELTKGVDYDLSYSDDVTNAGTVTVTVTGKGNYTGTTTVEYKINKRPVTLVSNGYTKNYDGTVLEDHDVAVTSQYDFVAGEVADLTANGSITEPGEVTNKITYTKKDGYKDSNYDVTITEGTLKVLPRDMNATGMEISELEDVVYNGLDQKQAPEVKDSKTGATLVAGTDYDVTFSEDTKSVGVVAVTITGKGNYTGTATRIYKITPAPLTVKTDGAAREYNGRALTAGGTITGLVNGESVDFKTTGSQTKVGSSQNSYSIDWTGAKKNNYKIVEESLGTLTVTESSQTIVVVTTGGRYEYDGLTHTPTVNVYNLPEGYTVHDASSNAAVKDVNARKDSDQGVKVTADNLVILNAEGEDVTSKLEIEKADGYLAVTPRTVTVTTPSDSKVYDGTALKAEGAIDGLVDGETAEFKTTGSQTEQGTSDNTYDLKWNGSAKKSNYTVKENIGTLTVSKQSIDKKDEKTYKGIQIDDPASVMYDGAKHQWTPTVTDAEGNTLAAGTDYKVTYKRGDDATDDFKNVGTITVTVEGAGNYTGTVTKTYKITKREVTLTSADGSWTYDGKDHQKADVAVSGDGFAEGEGVDYSDFATVKDVTAQDVENTFKYVAKDGTDLECNYTIKVVAGKLSVTKAAAEGNITLRTKDATKTYDGQALEAGEATAQAATDDDVRIEYSLDHETWTENRSEVALTDAGNQTVYVRASSKKSYSGYVEGTENLTVNPATVTIVTNSGEKVYDGKTLTADGSMKGLVNGETATFKVTGSLAAVGEIDNAYTLTWDGTAKRDNYTIEDAVGKLKVTPRSIDDTDYGMTVSSPEDVTYDGTEHKWAPVVKDGNKTLVEGTDYTVAYDKDDFTNVTGTIKMTITGKGNYTGSVDRFYQITPAQLTVETEGTSKVYDGEALTHDVATIKGLKNGESATIHATGTQTEVGESDNNYQITWDGSAKQGNYTVARETLGKLVVSESADQITATPVNVTAQYDGEAHGTTVEVTGLPKGYTVKEVKSKATATNVSDGEVTAKVDELVIINAQGKDVTSKLNIKRGAATIKITPAPLTVSTDGGKKEYDGTALTAKGIKVDGLKGGDKVSARATGSRTKVGTSDNTYSIDWTGAKASNYTVTDELGTLEVTPSTAAVTLMSGSDTRVYNGRALSSDKITAEGLPAGFTVEATMDGSQTDAGSSKNTVKSYRILDAKGDDVTGMFTNVTVKPGTLKVTPKQITVETEGATKVYDGTALTNGNGTISGLISGERADVVTNGAQIEVGSSKNGYTIAWGTAKEGNYTVASDKLGDLVVTSQSVNPDDPTYRNLTVNDPEDVTYDGNAHKWAPEVKDASGNTLKEGVDYALSYSTDDFVDAGAITVTITGKGNYSGTVSKTYRIKPASVSIKTDSASRAYNGRALTAGGAITGLVNGETVDFKTTGARTKVGTSDNTYALNWTGSAKASNYSIDSIEIGKLTITESADEIVVTTTGGTFTYDGKAHGASVAVSQLPEGYTLETAAATATVTDVTDEAVKATADQLVIRNAEGEDVTSRLNIKKVDGTITVNPAELTVATDSASKVYDGIALTAGGTVTGLVNGEEATLDMTGKQAEVGSSENTYKLTFDKSAKAKNYKVVSENIGTLTVTAQSITPGTEEEPSDSYKGITVSDPEDSVYDGTEHQWSPVVEDAEGNELEEGADYEVAYDTDDFVDVATITVTITGKGNYAGTVTKSYRITKAPLHIATGSATKVYDGAALTDATVTVDGLAQTDRIGITVTGQQTAVGNSKNSYTIDWMQVNQDNYELTDELGTLTVTPAPVTPQNPATPGVTPTTSGAPGGTPAASTGNNVVNTIATALASGYSAVTGDNDATAPSEEQIFDAQNPLGKFEGKKDTCWVHWYMILCGIVTAVYGVLVGLRRRKHSRRLQKDLDKVLGNDDEAQE